MRGRQPLHSTLRDAPARWSCALKRLYQISGARTARVADLMGPLAGTFLLLLSAVAWTNLSPLALVECSKPRKLAPQFAA
jgi:hypothetical protein